MTTETLETIATIGRELVEHSKTEPAGGDIIAHDSKLWDKHFAESWDSVEGDGQTHTGREAVIAKYHWWMDNFNFFGAEVTGPFVGPSGFSVIFDMDVEPKDGSSPRMRMKEVAIYTVENGKIVREEFQMMPRS